MSTRYSFIRIYVCML